MYHILFIHPAADGYFGFFPCLTIISNASMNINIQAFSGSVFISLEWIYRSKIARFCVFNNSMCNLVQSMFYL